MFKAKYLISLFEALLFILYFNLYITISPHGAMLVKSGARLQKRVSLLVSEMRYSLLKNNWNGKSEPTNPYLDITD